MMSIGIVFLHVIFILNSVKGQSSELNVLNGNNEDCTNLVPEDAVLSFTELAAKYGHPATSYNVVTEDGYILKVFRIPGKRRTRPILLFHGVLDSADTWIIRGNSSLSMTLARNGEDVWLGNVRGNKYSRGHVSLDPVENAAEYWNFTFNEYGIHDLAATIDLVLSETGAEKLNAFGHSQGNTIFYVLCSSRPEYNDKINFMAALAPIAFLQYNPPPVSTLILLSQALTSLFLDLKIYEVFDENSLIIQVLRLICPLPVIGYAVCAFGITFPLSGFDPPEFGPCFLRVSIRHFPLTTSVKNLRHFGQVGRNKRFARYDYGRAGNLIAYNSSVPPEYDLSKVTTQVMLLPARNDFLSTLPDVAILRRQLPNVARYRIIPRPLCNHLDFVSGKNMPVYLYPELFDILQTYN